jgi:hypothetical protein
MEAFMKREFLTRFLGAVALACSAGLASTPSFAQDYEDVRRAHEAYLRADFQSTDDVREVMVAIKAALLNHPSDATVLQNLLQLNRQVTARAYEVRDASHILSAADGEQSLKDAIVPYRQFVRNHGEIIPLDWSLPEEMMFPVIGVSKQTAADMGATTYSLNLWSWLSSADAVENLRLVRYPDEVVLDKRLGIGSWHSVESSGDWPAAIEASTGYASAPPQEGLYLFDVEISGKQPVHGWIILSDVTSTSSPGIEAPSPDQVYRSGRPEFHWRDFRSAQYRGFEHRKLQLGVAPEGATDGDRLWRLAIISPDFVRATLGRHPNGRGVDHLDPGAYTFTFAQEERWLFGSVLLSRATRSPVSFTVAK